MTNTTTGSQMTWMTPRTRGAMTGFGLVLLGAWGAVIPFVGQYFDYSYTPDTTWTWTAARFYLQVLPGAVAFLAGLLLLGTANRAVGSLVSWLAAAAGAWFVVGPLLAPLWRSGYLGAPIGDSTNVSMEQLGMFFGLGAAIMLLSGVALGRFSVVGVRDLAYAERHAVADKMVPAVNAEGPAIATDPAVATAPATTDTRAGWTHRRHRFVAH